jgi:hypothetical protein
LCGSGVPPEFPEVAHGLVVAARDAQQPTHHLDGEGHILGREERELHSLSLAEKVAVAFTVSRSIYSHLFSRRSRVSSLRSAVVKHLGRAITRIHIRTPDPAP